VGIHARQLHPSFYDLDRLWVSQTGIDYLRPIFVNAVGVEDMHATRLTLFADGNLTQPNHSANIDVN
jgi:hypothetical protein